MQELLKHSAVALTFCIVLTATVPCNAQQLSDIIYNEDYHFEDMGLENYFLVEGQSVRYRDPEQVMYPTQLGKAIVYLADHEWADLSFGEDFRIILEVNQNFQFIPMYMFFPMPTQSGAQFLPQPQVNIVYEFKSGSNPYSIYQFLSSSTLDPKGNQRIGHPFPFSHSEITYQIPKAAENHLYQRIEDAKQSLDFFGLLEGDQKDLLETTFDSFYEGVFEKQNVIYDENEPFENLETLQGYNGKFTAQELNPSQVLYAISDDVAQLFLNEAGDTAYIVDTSSPSFFNGLDGLLVSTSSIKHVYLFMTHYHIDHVQGAAAFVNRTSIPMTFLVPRAQALSFCGWYLENYNHLISKISSGALQVKVLEEGWHDVDGFQLKALYPHLFEDNRMKHFALNSAPAFKDSKGNCRVFSGDFMTNPQMFDSSDEMLEALLNWFSEVLVNLEADSTSAIDIYIDLGHFFPYVRIYEWQDDEGLLSLEQFQSCIHEAYPNYPYLNVVMVHVKETTGFTMAIRESYSDLFPEVTF